MIIDRSKLRRAERSGLERLARFLKLPVSPEWPHDDLVELVLWRIVRTGGRRR
jgi:hypothetical protein